MGMGRNRGNNGNGIEIYGNGKSLESWKPFPHTSSSRACPSSGKCTWYSSILVLRLMQYTAVTCCWLTRFCLSCVRSLASSLSSSKTVLLHAHRACETISLLEWGHPLSFHKTTGSQQSRSEPNWLQNLGRYAAASTSRNVMTLMNRSNMLHVWRVAWSKA